MKRQYFEQLENESGKRAIPINDVIDQLAFDQKGLIPVITQDANTKDVLMFAWMTKGALKLTLATKRMTYWSRSRKQLWVKGETSGHTQELVSMQFDCDGDAVLCLVDQTGSACHTERKNCFYLMVNNTNQEVTISNE